jgi:periplasmic divalent cation tolerance protein
MKRNDLTLIVTMVPETGVGEAIAEVLVSSKVAACVNIIGGATSCYRWKGKLQKDSEALLLVKTRTQLASRVQEIIEDIHPYELPEVVVLPITGGSERYLNWVVDETEVQFESKKNEY